MAIAVVGSGGFVGRHLVAHLRSRGLDVNEVSSAVPGGIDRDTGTLHPEFRLPDGTEAVVYLAQSPWYRRTPEMAEHVLQVNLASAVKLAELSRRARVPRFIYTSTGSVYAASFSPLAEDAPVRRDNWYALSKVQAEEALALFRQELELIVVRPFAIYGPGQSGRLVPNLARSISRGDNVELQRNPHDPADNDGLRISLCHVDDVVRVYEWLLLHGGPGCLNLAGPVASMRRIATRIGDLLGRAVSFQVADKARESDLIADTSLLEKHCPVGFRDLDAGLGPYVGADAETGR